MGTFLATKEIERRFLMYTTLQPTSPNNSRQPLPSNQCLPGGCQPVSRPAPLLPFQTFQVLSEAVCVFIGWSALFLPSAFDIPDFSLISSPLLDFYQLTFPALSFLLLLPSLFPPLWALSPPPCPLCSDPEPHCHTNNSLGTLNLLVSVM